MQSISFIFQGQLLIPGYIFIAIGVILLACGIFVAISIRKELASANGTTLNNVSRDILQVHIFRIDFCDNGPFSQNSLFSLLLLLPFVSYTCILYD